MRFDDTNPISESKEYEKAILEDLIECGFDMSNLSYTSDSFDFLISKATELIKLGWAYVDNSTQEEISIQRKNLIGSINRNDSVENNLKLWNKMINNNTIDESNEFNEFNESNKFNESYKSNKKIDWVQNIGKHLIESVNLHIGDDIIFHMNLCDKSDQSDKIDQSDQSNQSGQSNQSDQSDKINQVNKNLTLRLKAYPDSKNGAMRDPILYRYVDGTHHRTGNKYNVYPTYDFACPILDSVDGVTHVFRSKEYVERDEQMKFILNKLNMRIPRVITYGRINVENTELSKRKIKEGIKSGIYTGWDDKKLFTYRGMKNRGISLSGINKLLDDIGFPETTITIQQQKIFTINTKIIDKNAHRIIAIKNDNQIIVDLEINDVKEKIIYNFTGNKNLGERKCIINNKVILDKKEVELISDQEEITLINFGNVIYHKLNILKPHFEGNPSATSKKVLWLNPLFITSVKLEILDGKLEDYIIESHIENIKIGEYVCINKIGYFYVKQSKLDGNNETILVKI